MDDQERRLELAHRRCTALVLVVGCVGPMTVAAVALALASGVLVEPGFATAVAVTALILLLC